MLSMNFQTEQHGQGQALPLQQQLASRKSPLGDTHASLGATMAERNGWSVPESYGDVLLEYAAVRECGAGLLDLSSRGRILVGGTEAVQFLNGLITNDMKTLAVGSWMPAAFPNVQGRLIASVRVVRLADEVNGTDKNVCPAFLLDTEAETHEQVLKTIQRFTFAGDFRVTDITNQTALISLQGKTAPEVMRSILGEKAASLAVNRTMQIVQIAQQGEVTGDVFDRVTVLRATHTGEHGFDLIVNSEQAPGIWKALQKAGARPLGYEALEILRIEAGHPRYGVDMDETNVVTEALDDAVSYTKGCYIGQEIIARIKYRGHVAKRLSGVLFDGPARVAAGATIKSAEDKEIGRITSSTYSPHLGRTVALGYLKYDFTAPGTSVAVISGEGKLPGQVIELPFLRNRER
jgi:folate-binding protein YgfZ